MDICFIPHSVMSAGLQHHPHAVLDKLCEVTGATRATYHKEDLWYVRLHNPTMAMEEIESEYANSFANVRPVWVG